MSDDSKTVGLAVNNEWLDAVKRIQYAASKDKNRPLLGVVEIKCERAAVGDTARVTLTATDSYIMASARVDVPAVDEWRGERFFYAPAKELYADLKGYVKKASDPNPIAAVLRFSVDDDNATRLIEGNDPDVPSRVWTWPSLGDFPNYRQIQLADDAEWSEDPGTVEYRHGEGRGNMVLLAPDKLKQVCAVTAGLKRVEIVTTDFSSSATSIRFKADHPDGGVTWGVLMGVRK